MHLCFQTILRVIASGSLLVALTACQGVREPDAPQPPLLSQSEASALIEDNIEKAWQSVSMLYPEAVRPDVDVVRIVDQNEWAPTVVRCMQENGFNSTVSRDGGVESGSIPSGQLSAYEVQYFACTAAYPLNPKYRVPFNEEQIEYLYWYYSNPLRSCLLTEGYDVIDPPSEARFLETFGTADEWYPYQSLRGLSEDAWYSISEKCPEVPELIYGETD